ncbi:MAG: hypothetical protein K940chlam7_00104 [Chlamydiae bacterium]|nr:hypothetical protein [Chlamydiota bacterium]
MQLFALDTKKQLVSANHAQKQNDYLCTECGSIVRLRGGEHRQKHFYHLKPDRQCRQSQKSLNHIQVQKYLQKILPTGECSLEQRFPEIQRIADVVWEPKKIIFEVQCSGITAEEIRSRNKDYLSVGYNVIWILHDNRFNKWKVTAAERFLKGSPHYFTNIDPKGRGFVYDQVDTIGEGVRKPVKLRCRVNLSLPKALEDRESVSTKEIPNLLEKRLELWPIFFGDDVMDRWIQSDQKTVTALQEIYHAERILSQHQQLPLAAKVKRFLYRYFVRPYLLLFQIFLEKACR